MYKHHDVILFGSKNGRAQYRKGQKSRENKNNKRGEENRRGEKGGGDYCRNKINPVIEKSSGFETSVYHDIIY